MLLRTEHVNEDIAFNLAIDLLYTTWACMWKSTSSPDLYIILFEFVLLYEWFVLLSCACACDLLIFWHELVVCVSGVLFAIGVCVCVWPVAFFCRCCCVRSTPTRRSPSSPAWRPPSWLERGTMRSPTRCAHIHTSIPYLFRFRCTYIEYRYTSYLYISSPAWRPPSWLERGMLRSPTRCAHLSVYMHMHIHLLYYQCSGAPI